MNPISLQETEKPNIHPERWKTLKAFADPPKQDWSMRLTESSFKRIAEQPKLATRWKIEGEGVSGGLTERPKRSKAKEENLIPGSKERSERPPMAVREERHTAEVRRRGHRRGASTKDDGGG